MPQELYQELLSRLARTRARKERADLTQGVFSGLGAALLIVLIATTIEAVGHLSIVGRTWLFWSTLLVAVGGICWVALPAVLVKFGIRSKLTDDDVAVRVGAHYPAVSDRLVNTLQLARSLFAETATLLGSPRFALAAFETTYSSVRAVDFNAIVDERPVKRAFLFFLLSVMLTAGVFLGAASEMGSAANRLLHYRTFYQKPAPFTFIVFPGNARVMRGDSVRVTIATRGEQLPQVALRLRQEGQKDFDALVLHAQPLDSAFQQKGFRTGFVYYLAAQHPIDYYAESGDIESDRFHISVLEHPIVRALHVTVTPPSYTREKQMVLSENIGDIAGVGGTRGDFRIAASAPLASASIVFQPGPDTASHGTPRPTKIIALQTESDSIATGSVTFLESGSYHIDLVDRDSVRSEHPIEYTVSIAKDEPPTIALIEPNDRTDLPSDMRMDMLARIRDDFGFRGVRLGYRRSKSKYADPETTYKWLDIPLPSYTVQEEDVPYIWNLSPMGLAPEDEISYVLTVTDNDAVSGPHTASTPEYTLRLPSVKEIFARADEEAKKAQKDLNEIKQDAQEVQKKVDEALNEMRQMKPSDIAKQQQDFSKQKDLQQILQRQADLQQRLQDVSKDVRQMTDQLDKQQALSPETLKKYEDLQELFKQINSPELKAAMDKLQQAMQQQHVDPKQLQDAMKNMQANEEQFRKSIERTTNILKKIQAEQKVDELMKQAGELGKEEQKTADDAKQSAEQNKPMSAEEKAAAERQQQDAQKELDRMREEAKELASQMKKLPESMQSPEEMKAAAEALSDPSTDNSMQQAADAGKKGDRQRQSQHAQDAANKMKNAKQKLAEMKKKLSENEKQKTMREMKQIRDELNRLSKAEESIKNKAQQASQNSNVFRDLAEEQSQKKDQLGQTATKAMQLAQRSTEITPEMGKNMGEAFADMQRAEDAMTDRNQPSAQQNSQGAMSALNKAAQQMQKAMQSMSQPSSGSGGSGGEGEEGQSSGDGSGEGQNPGGKSGSGGAMQQFLSQINKLTAQQQALTNQMQGMAQGQGGTQSAQQEMMRQQAQLKKMAAQQQAMQKSLQQLSEEQQSARSGNKAATDDLKKIADEMQDVISDMRSHGINPETVQRQERILSRLLEAERSVHERDKDQQRESKSGQNVARSSPPALSLPPAEAQKQLQDELLHAREMGYSKDYNTLIRKYFESLEKQKK